MHIRSWLVLISASVLISACGGKSKKTDFFGEEFEPKKPKVSNTVKIKRNWSVNLGGSINLGAAQLSPIQIGQSIFAASANGKVYKVAAATGKTEWSAKLNKEMISAGVGAGRGLVLVGTDQGRLYAFDQTDGSISWQADLDSEILASPVVGADVVVARSGDGKVYGLSADSGERLWTISRQLPKLTVRGDSRPIVTQGVVFVGFSDGYLAALEADTGRALWDFPLAFARGSNEIDRLSDIDTDPLLVGETLYLSSFQEVTHALDIRNQRISWSAEVSSYNPLSYDAAYLYVSDKNGLVHQIARNGGAARFSQDGLRGFALSAPMSVGPYVLVGEGDGGLYALSKENGAFVGKVSLGAKSIIGEPIVDADTVYLIDSDGSLRSISVVTSN